MCARFEFMFRGFIGVHITVGPGGRQVPPPVPNVFDVRRNYFPNDDNLGMLRPEAVAGQLALLRDAAQELWQLLVRHGAQRVQCEKGQARSPRVVGAFFMMFYGDNVEQVMRRLAAAFAGPRDGCNQTLGERAVREWLESFYNSPYRRIDGAER